MDSISLLPGTMQMPDTHYCDVPLICTGYTTLLLFSPYFFSYSISPSSSLDISSSHRWLDLSSYIDSPLTASLFALPLPRFEIYVVSMGI
jgi:hypothetical protein